MPGKKSRKNGKIAKNLSQFHSYRFNSSKTGVLGRWWWQFSQISKIAESAVLVFQVNGGFRFYMVYGDHQSLSYFSLVLQVMHDVSFLLQGVFTLAVVLLQEGLIPASRYFLL